MSQQLINRIADLKRLRDEGYEVKIKCNHLIVKNVPYLNSKKEIKRGTLVSTLTLAGDVTTIPDDHQAHFHGEVPCNADGTPNGKILNQSAMRALGDGLVINHSFSAKPKSNQGRYVDYHEKMTTSVAILSGPAQAHDPSVTAQTFAVVESGESESPYTYIDTASSRAEIGPLVNKLKGGKVAIVGLGGTGSYVLDLIAKTPITEIHLFDGDDFLQHNAFRAPGAASLTELQERLKKVKYFERIYSRMHRGIFSHTIYIDSTTVEKLKPMSFVFLCLDNGPAKELIVQRLEEFGVPFVDVGMGVYLCENSLGGVVRVTASTVQMRNHIKEKGRISFGEADEINEYNRNIQIADLNALNAALAVIKWKKLMGFYLDLDQEHFSTYTIDGNALTNEDKPEGGN